MYGSAVARYKKNPIENEQAAIKVLGLGWCLGVWLCCGQIQKNPIENEQAAIKVLGLVWCLGLWLCCGQTQIESYWT